MPDLPNDLKISERLNTAIAPPLFRTSRADGEIYQRLPAVEQQIAAVLQFNSRQIARQMLITQRDDRDFLAEETLIHFLRAAVRAGEFDFADEITGALYRRIQKSVQRQCRKIFANAAIAHDCAADALGELFAELYDDDRTRADFAEVRFGLFLKRIVNRSVGKYLKRQRLENDFEFLDEAPADEDAPKQIAAPGEISTFDRYDAKKALALLPEPVRTAFILRHKYGLQIESANGSEMTIAKYFDKTERTIRNWLRRADRILEELRQR